MTLQGVDALNLGLTSAQLAALGKHFVVRYTRNVTAAELAADRAAGIGTVLVFETSGVDFTGLSAQGRADATLAQSQLAAVGVPNAPVYFAIDASTSLLQDVNDYLQGCCAVLGKARVGVYGDYSVVTAAHAGSWCAYFWQTYAWSGGSLNNSVHLYQYSNSVTLSGAVVDLDQTVVSDVDYGQVKWEDDVRLGIFFATVVAGPNAGQTGQFLSNGMFFRWIPPAFTDAQGATADPLADITGETGPWFNNGLAVETWPGGPVADVGAFGLPADPTTAAMLGLDYPYPAPASSTGLTAAQAQQLADLSAAVARIEAALKTA